MVDYIADYLQNIRSRRVFPNVSPGYMKGLVPDSAPDKGEPWDDIFQDVERVVMPGVSFSHSYVRFSNNGRNITEITIYIVYIEALKFFWEITVISSFSRSSIKCHILASTHY